MTHCRILPAHEDGGGQQLPPSLLVSATKAAKAIRRGKRYDDRYELADMIQDGCLAQLQGRQAWYGVIDGLRSWIHEGKARLRTVPITCAMRECRWDDPLHRIIVEQQYRDVMRRMDRWQPKRRTAWMLRYEEEKSEPQIGAILGVTPGRVSQWLRS